MMLLAPALTLVLAAGPAAPAPDEAALKRTVEVEQGAVERAPDDTEALYRLGLALLALGDGKRAIKPLEELVKQDPESIDGKLLLSRAYVATQQPDKAKTLLDTAIESTPDDSGLQAARAELARDTDDLEGAVAHYRKAVDLADNDPTLVFNLAEALQAQKSQKALEEAVALYKKALEMKPDFTAAKVNLGKAKAEQGLFGEAKDILSAVSKEDLTDAEAHYNLGVILMRENATTAAITEFERTLAINPKHAYALNNLGVAWDGLGEPKKALLNFKKATRVDPTFGEAFFNTGMAYLELKQSAQATAAFEKALKLEPSETGPYVKLGTVFLEQGKRDRAVEAFKRAIALQEKDEKEASGFLMLRKRLSATSNTDAYRGLALAYLGLGKVDEAVAALKQAVEKLPRDASARQALGEAYLAQGNFDGAVEQLKVRLDLEPTTEARLDLARALTKKGVAKEAEPLFKDIIKTEPTNREARVGLVDLYVAMGRFAEAEDILKDMVEKDPADALALSRIGILKSRMGRPDQALEPLEKAVALNPSLFDARAEYAYLLLRADPNNADRCVRMVNDILITEPRHALSLYYRGVCQYALGQKQKAEASFKQALSIDAKSGAVHFSLGELYENDKKTDQALKEYQEASKLGFAEADGAVKRLKGGGSEKKTP